MVSPILIPYILERKFVLYLIKKKTSCIIRNGISERRAFAAAFFVRTFFAGDFSARCFHGRFSAGLIPRGRSVFPLPAAAFRPGRRAFCAVCPRGGAESPEKSEKNKIFSSFRLTSLARCAIVFRLCNRVEV